MIRYLLRVISLRRYLLRDICSLRSRYFPSALLAARYLLLLFVLEQLKVYSFTG